MTKENWTMGILKWIKRRARDIMTYYPGTSRRDAIRAAREDWCWARGLQ